jgi:phosphoserine phosphatase
MSDRPPRSMFPRGSDPAPTGPDGRPLRLVAFDMDGTLVDARSSWAEVHHYFHDSNEEALRAFMADEIDDEEFSRRDLALWHRHQPDICVDDLERILAGVPLMPGAHELVAALRARKVRTAIVSGGLDVLAARIQRELGIDIALANGFVTRDGGLLVRGNIRVPVKQKERVLRDLQAQLQISPEETASVGNSEIDVGLFRASRIGIAFSPDDDIVRRHASFVVEERDLRKLLPLLAP